MRWVACRTQVNISVHNSKQKIAWMGWKQEVSLSGYHLVVFSSRTCYNISYEREHSGIPADMKIMTIGQLIGIMLSYFWSYLSVGIATYGKHKQWSMQWNMMVQTLFRRSALSQELSKSHSYTWLWNHFKPWQTPQGWLLPFKQCFKQCNL